jgi:hypothetical protein
LKPVPLKFKLPLFTGQKESVGWSYSQQFSAICRLFGKPFEERDCAGAFEECLVDLSVHHDPTAARKLILVMIDLDNGSGYAMAAACTPKQGFQLRVKTPLAPTVRVDVSC